MQIKIQKLKRIKVRNEQIKRVKIKNITTATIEKIEFAKESYDTLCNLILQSNNKLDGKYFISEIDDKGKYIRCLGEIDFDIYSTFFGFDSPRTQNLCDMANKKKKIHKCVI